VAALQGRSMQPDVQRYAYQVYVRTDCVWLRCGHDIDRHGGGIGLAYGKR
jgi:hypothetical protein